jgi:flavin-dependent dehydrogenase
MSEMFDVAIVGGGIAGCAAAIELARKNLRVVVFETKSYPHHKVCGEFLSPECTILLDELGLTAAIRSVKPTAIDTVCITAPDGTSWQSKLPGTAIGLSRYTLDNLMAEQARGCGVDFRESTTVTQIHGRLDTTFTLDVRTATRHDSIQARAVIGAHGKRSPIDRTLKRAFLKTPQPFVGLKAHFYGPPLPGRIHLYTFPGGYCGLSEIENGQVNVCLLVRQEVFERVSTTSPATITGFIDWMKTQNPALGAWLSAAQPVYQPWISIAQVPFVDKQTVVNDILMVGDSAGLITPIAGDGMGMALQASFIASRLLAEYLSGQISADCLRHHYNTEWWSAFRLRLRLSRLLQAFMLRPRWLTLGLQLMNAAPMFGQFLVTHTRDSRGVQT